MEKKKETIRNTVEELIGNGNLGMIEKSFAADYIAHAGEKSYSGHSFMKRFVNQLRTAIPDLQVKEVKFFVQDEDTIAWQRTLEGTSKAVLRGIPSSWEKVKWVEMIVTRFENGKIAEEWIVSELMGELLLRVPQS